MIDTQETVHDTIKELDDFLKCSDEEKERYEDKDFSYLEMEVLDGKRRK